MKNTHQNRSIFEVIFYLLFAINSAMIFSQEIISDSLPKIIPPSPEAFNISKFGQIPLNLSSGTPNINIPLIEINGGKYKLPLSLTYSSNGIKVYDNTPYTGLGWTLNAGGVITRNINGSPDEYRSYNLYMDYYNTIDLSNFTDEYFTFLISNSQDKERDVFSFNFMGHSGTFYLDNNNKPVLVNSEGLIIDFSSNGFTIVDENGIIYVFGGDPNYIETTEKRADHGTIQGSGVTAWYLKRVSYPNGDYFDFEYTNEDYHNFTPQMEVIKYVKTLEGCSDEMTSSHYYHAYTNTVFISEAKYLSKIISKLDTVNFTSSAQEGGWGSGHRILNRISSRKHIIDLEYSLQENTSRYFLDELVKRSSIDYNNSEKYSFGYISKELLPNPNSKAIDHYGYYNGVNQGSLLPKVDDGPSELSACQADREPRELTAMYGLLNRITYPTGGYTVLEYQANKDPFGQIVYNQIGGTVQGIEGSCYSGGEYNIVNFPFEVGVEGSFKLDISVGGDVNDPLYTRGIMSYKLFDSNDLGNPIRELHSQRSSIVITDNIEPGSYFIQVSVRCDRLTTSFTLDYPKELGEKLYGGSVLKVVKSYTDTNNMVLKKIYDYQYGTFRDVSYPITGFMIIEPCPTDGWLLPNEYKTTVNYTYRSDAVLPYSSSMKPAIFYNKVVEKIVNPQENTLPFNHVNSCIVHFYTSQHPPKITSFTNPPYETGYDITNIDTEIPMHPLGKVREVLTNYYKDGSDTNGELVRSEYKYSEISDYNSDSSLNFSVQKIGRTHESYPYGNPEALKDYFLEWWRMSSPNFESTSNWLVLKKEKTVDYFDDNEISTIVEYQYDNPQHYQATKIMTTNSDGTIITEKRYYPYDQALLSNLSGDAQNGIDHLIYRHMLTHIIQSETYKGNETQLLGTKRINYNVWGNNMPLVKSIQTSKGDGALEDRIIYYSYDAYGNPKEVSKESGAHLYYIWGYHGKHPIAKIENFSSSEATSIQDKINTAIIKSNEDDEQGTSVTEEELRTALNAIRNDDALSNAIMTAYTYDPLVGITSIILPNGELMYYEYDSLYRLHFIKDKEGNILEENQYHYRD